MRQDGEARCLTGRTQFPADPLIKKILVTGGAGFIGSWVVRHLVKQYAAYHVVCFDHLEYCASRNNVDMLEGLPNFSFVHGDICKPGDVTLALRTHQIDTILHFAAYSHVDLSFGNSYAFTHTNVYGTHVLLECAKAAAIRKFIHVSTDEVYGEVKDDTPDLRETALLSPTNPYAATKAAAEMLVNAYQKSFKLPAIIIRSNNVYGPHQFPEKVIPKFICLLKRHRSMPLHGNGTNKRPYLYAADTTDAIDTVLHKGVIGQTYNIASTDEVANVDLCSKLAEIFDVPVADFVTYTKDRPFNDHRYAIDSAKLEQLGWRQNTSFEEGLQRTVEWYREFGEVWWGKIDGILSAFPVIKAGQFEVVLSDMNGYDGSS